MELAVAGSRTHRTEQYGLAWVVSAVRSQINRLIVAVAIAGCLPLVIVAERVRSGGGQAVARFTTQVVAWLCGISFDVRGTERLRAGCSYVFVPNHTSPLDIPAMLVARPDVRFLAASELFRHPVLAVLMRALGTLPIDRDNAHVARRQLAELAKSEEPLRLTVFAEGRIARPDERVPFKSGAFVLAITTGASVVPVVIRGGHLLPPGRALAVRSGTVTVEFLEPIATAGLSLRDRKVVRDRTREAILSRLSP